MGLQRQPPLEQVHDGIGPAVPAPLVPEGEPLPAPAAPVAEHRSARRRARDAWRRLDRSPRATWAKKIMGFPIGERFAAISISAALFDARTTFIVLLAWGGFAATYAVAGRTLRSLGRRGVLAVDRSAVAGAGTLDAYRDDGPLALALGRLPVPSLPAAPIVLAGVLPLVALIAITGDGASWLLAGLALAWLVVLAGITATRPLRDRLRWLVPPALRVAEYAGLLWFAALAGPSAVPAAFALLLAVTYRQYDLVYRLRHRGVTPPRWVNLLAGGWDGRLLAGFALAAAALVPAGCYVAAGLFAAVVVGESVHGWIQAERGRQPDVYEDEEEDAE
jgi:hypothetical protein